MSSNRVIASPLARHMADEAGLDLHRITPSGPNGRIIKRDIEAAKKASGAIKAAAPTPSTGDGGALHGALCRPWPMRALITGPTNMMNCLWI